MARRRNEAGLYETREERSENLLHKGRRPAHGFGDIEQVEEHQRKMDNFLSAAPINGEVQQEIFDKEIKRLERIQGLLEKNENRLLKTLGLPEGYAGFQILQDKLYEWFDSGADRLLNKGDEITEKTVEIIQNSFTFKDDGQWREVELITSDPDVVTELRNAINAQIVDNFDLFVEYFSAGLFSDRKKTKQNHTNWDKFQTFLKNNVIITPTDDGVLIQIDKTNSRHYYKKFVDILEKKFEKSGRGRVKRIPRLNEETKKNIVNEIIVMLGSSKCCSIIYKELKENFLDKYRIDISYDKQVIKGFLGEVYWNSFFRWISQDKITAQHLPVGNIRNLKNQEISIDIFLNKFGAQVKNYDVGDVQQTLTFQSFSFTLQGMFDRLEMPEAAKTFKNFYFSAVYNAPNYNYSDDDLFPYYCQVYENFKRLFGEKLENPKTEVVNSLKGYMIANLDKFIGINRDLQLGDEVLKSLDIPPEQRVNTLYLVKDRIIPSSRIIAGVINLMKYNKGNVRVVNFTLKGSEAPRVKNYWPLNESVQNFIAFTKYANVSYKIDIDISGVLAEMGII